MQQEIVKPPYRVPLMSEIAKIKPNRFSAISTFAGGGGSSLGYRMAGFKMRWANEFIDAAREVYAANAAPGTLVDGRDIRLVDPLAVLRELGLKPGDLDLLDGSPPCSDFSSAGKRSDGWGRVKKYSNKEQRVDDLFFEYVRFIKAIQPRVFVAENVSGLVKGVAKGYFLEILRAMKACGYRVEARLLDAQWLGVPQARERLIFVGVREDLDLAPAFPEPLTYRYSVLDAIPELGGAITPGGRGNRRRREEKKPHELDEPLTSVMADGARKGDCQFMVEIVGNSNASHSRKNERRSVGGPARTILARRSNLDVVVRQGANGAFGDATWQDTRSNPSPTIGTGPSSGNGLSPPSMIEVVRGGDVEKRKFTIAELKRIGAFPDDFKLSGTYGQQWERIGRAVPPLMMLAIASTIRDKVLIPLREREKCEARLRKDSGRKSGKGSPTSAGRGLNRRLDQGTVTSGSIAKEGLSRRTSSRSKKNSVVD